MKALVVIVACTLAACAPPPGALWRANVHALSTGQSTEDQISTAIGSRPVSIERTDNELGHFARMTYVVGDMSNGSEGRQIIVEVRDGKYNGYRYMSTFNAEKQSARPSKTYAFVPGKTTKADVRAAVELPTAVVRCPSTLVSKCIDDTEAWVWDYGKEHSVAAAFDGAGVVRQ